MGKTSVRPSSRKQFALPKRIDAWLEACSGEVRQGAYAALALSMLVMAALSGGRVAGTPAADSPEASKFKMESTAFKQGGDIPTQFTCEGDDLSPPLRWAHAPEGTRSFALIADDPDAPAGTWVHWVVYDLPARVQSLSENVPKQGKIRGGGVQGQNSFGNIGYGGPCPPPGKAHHYFFTLYALDTTLNLRPGSAKEEVINSAKGHVLGEAQLMGLFGR